MSAPRDWDSEPLSVLNLSVRPRKCLEVAGVATVGQLCAMTEDDFKATKGFGETSLREVRRAVERLGLRMAYPGPGQARALSSPSFDAETGQVELQIVADCPTGTPHEYELRLTVRDVARLLMLTPPGSLAEAMRGLAGVFNLPDHLPGLVERLASVAVGSPGRTNGTASMNPPASSSATDFFLSDPVGRGQRPLRVPDSIGLQVDLESDGVRKTELGQTADFD